MLPIGLICCRPTKYHIELMLWIWEHRAALLLVLVLVKGTLRWVLDVLLYVVLQGVTVFCRMFPFRVKRASGIHYFLEVLGAGSSGWSAAVGSYHQIVTLALAVFWFGGLC